MHTTLENNAVPYDTRPLYAKAHSLFTRERFADSAVFFRLMLTLDPENENGWLGLGLCHEKQGDLSTACNLYMLGDAAKPSARCLIAAARLLRQLDNDELATRKLERALNLAEASDQPELARLAALELEH